MEKILGPSKTIKNVYTHIGHFMFFHGPPQFMNVSVHRWLIDRETFTAQIIQPFPQRQHRLKKRGRPKTSRGRSPVARSPGLPPCGGRLPSCRVHILNASSRVPLIFLVITPVPVPVPVAMRPIPMITVTMITVVAMVPVAMHAVTVSRSTASKVAPIFRYTVTVGVFGFRVVIGELSVCCQWWRLRRVGEWGRMCCQGDWNEWWCLWWWWW